MSLSCPVCNHKDTSVKDSRPIDGGVGITRRRECDNADCKHRFTTEEYDTDMMSKSTEQEIVDNFINGLDSDDEATKKLTRLIIDSIIEIRNSLRK